MNKWKFYISFDIITPNKANKKYNFITTKWKLSSYPVFGENVPKHLPLLALERLMGHTVPVDGVGIIVLFNEE